MLLFLSACQETKEDKKLSLWEVYDQYLQGAKYVDLTHAFGPDIPVWPGFGNATFMPTQAGKDIPGYVAKGDTFSLEKHGFIATSYFLPTDQYGTQLDPPAHWNPTGATISDLPPTYAIRPLVVLDIHEEVAKNPGYHAGIEDIESWEKSYGKIPAGSVVMVRSDWYKKWQEVDRYNQKPFPGVGLDALKFLHEERNILFHGHEALDTDTTTNLEGEYWLLHNNYCQAEGVKGLDQVPESGALLAIGFAKPEGGTGGYARYIAICPPDWEYGTSILETAGAPLPSYKNKLVRDARGVLVESK
ncbi:MAG: cyclase family protein [Bacteroidota bacterium]